MTKEKSLYQVKLILDCLPEEEYSKISEETIKYIEENMEYSDDIKINPDIPLENQKIDDKTYDFLEKIVKDIESPKNKKMENTEENTEENLLNGLDRKKLIELLEKYKAENTKIQQAKELLDNYKKILENKDREITKLKKTNQDLYESIQKCPKLFRKILFKDFDKKLLK
ncbi:MAG: hypothetical protein IKD76_03455 [Clostridia bacterium]|nr:hypothetical protein [Clostridia bacterium]